jgi:tetratricopeptide (TPR) repeat protein
MGIMMTGAQRRLEREERARREELIERFEMAFQAGPRPALEEHLPADPAERRAVLIELVHTELELRLKAGEPARVEEYLERFPELAALPEVEWGLIVTEYTQRGRQEPALSLEEYLRRFPLRKADLLAWRPARDLPPPATVIRTVPHAGATSPYPIPPPPVPGYIPCVPGYEVLGELGRGGMGVVYKARQIKLKRLTALKMVLAGGHAGESERARFGVEAEAVARLQHPNVVQVFEVGEADGLPYLAMEYVEDGSLEGRLDGTPWLAPPAARLVEVLARAMHAAHRRGIVHRDLKPANVLLARTEPPHGLVLGGEEPAETCYEPKVTDFGLAKKLDEAALTQTGVVMGTPSYMAPEQAQGNAREVGPAADVYALGAILYELITGRPPFRAANAFDTVLQVIAEEPVLPSRLQPKLPRDLETICLKCLEKEPARRYASARALADDLQRFREARPIQARPAGKVERALKWARRNRAQAALGVVTGLALLALLAASAIYARLQSNRADATAQENERLVEREVARNQIDQHVQSARQHEAQGRWPEARAEWDKAQAALDSRPDLRVDELRAEVRERRALVQQRLEADTRERQLLGAYDDAVFYETLFTGLDPASNRARLLAATRKGLAVYGLDREPAPGSRAPLLEQDRPHLGPARYARLASACYALLLIRAEAEAAPLAGQGEARPQKREQARQTLALLDRAETWGKAHGLDARTFHLRKARYQAWARGEEPTSAPVDGAAPAGPTGALDWFLAGLDSYRRGQFDEARRACGEVLKREDDHFWARYVQALCHLRAGHWAEACADLTALALRRPGFVWPRLLRGFAASELAFTRTDRQQADAEFDAAEVDFNWALQQDRDPLAQYVGLTNRGVLHLRRQRWQEAVRDLRQAIRVNPEAFPAHANLAQALQGLRRWGEALAALDQAIKLAPDQGVLYESRAKLHLLRRDRAAARADFERAIAREPKESQSLRLVNDLVELGRLLHQEGKYPEALARYDRALQARPGFVVAERFRAETLLKLGRPGEAGRALDRYLQAKETTQPPVEVYRARGLIHAEAGELPAAIEVYTRALGQYPEDTTTRCLRGWLYLVTDAVRLARKDFEECVRRDPASGDALAGRGTARIRLRQLLGPTADAELRQKLLDEAAADARAARQWQPVTVAELRQKLLDEATADAEAAERQGPVTDRLLYNIARIHAHAAAQLDAEARTGRDQRASRRCTLHRERTLDYLRRALEMVPAERRAAFWRDQVQADPALQGIRQGVPYYELEKRYGRPPS